ncbi:MAG TPA: hypothetical protein VFM51_07135 [Solirubrobacterales bacterium]|nr:hypothetical protein [Solirubrobacterales bacterium]
MSLLRRVAVIYARIWRTYWGWAPSILLLSAIVFVPLGLLDALTMNVELDALNVTTGLELAAIAIAVGVVTATGLIGEVLFSGAIAISLTHPHGEDPPPLNEIARRLRYGRLIAVDLAFVAIVAAGLLLGLVPGVVAFVFLGLAGPVVELEDRTAAGALRRSFQLVRGSFWLVFWVLVPIEIAGDAIGGALAAGVHHLLGHTFVATWLAEALADALLSPVFAVAAVLLTVDAIAANDGAAPPLHTAPVPALQGGGPSTPPSP